MVWQYIIPQTGGIILACNAITSILAIDNNQVERPFRPWQLEGRIICLQAATQELSVE